jgi:hypothetical protein
MPRICPSDFEVTPALKAWAKKQGISDRDVRWQTEVFMDHEFKRSYTHWDRVWRNWMRKCIEIGTVIPAETDLDRQAKEFGITRGPDESDERLRMRIGIEATKKHYGLE